MATRKQRTSAGFPRVDLQHDNRAFLDAALRGRIPPLLFTGPTGAGKLHVAVDYARRICCERTPVCELTGDLCESCTKALALEHPGIHLIFPTPTLGSGEKAQDDEPDIGKILDEKRHDFFATHAFPKKVSLRIARARAIIQRANMKPFGSSHNVFVIYDTHEMREEAQNALLKIVEEPPAQCALIAITNNPDAILYTIRSRCQRVRFSPLKAAVVESLLMNYYDIAAGVASKAADLAQGSINRAIELAREHDDEERAQAYNVFSKLHDASESWVIDAAMTVARRASRDNVARFLHELAVAYRDVMAEHPDLYINRDQTKVLTAQTGRWPRENLPDIINRIIDARNGILRRNLNTEAALVDLFLGIRRDAVDLHSRP
jgi:DNA polymerase-3 subunit delta'